MSEGGPENDVLTGFHRDGHRLGFIWPDIGIYEKFRVVIAEEATENALLYFRVDQIRVVGHLFHFVVEHFLVRSGLEPKTRSFLGSLRESCPDRDGASETSLRPDNLGFSRCHGEVIRLMPVRSLISAVLGEEFRPPA